MIERRANFGERHSKRIVIARKRHWSFIAAAQVRCAIELVRGLRMGLLIESEESSVQSSRDGPMLVL